MFENEKFTQFGHDQLRGLLNLGKFKFVGQPPRMLAIFAWLSCSEIDISNAKVDIMLYFGQDYLDAYNNNKAYWTCEPTLWLWGDDLQPFCGDLAAVTQDTIYSHIEDSPHYALLIENFTDVVPEVDQIVLDLSQFTSRKTVFVDAIPFSQLFGSTTLDDFTLQSRFNQTMANVRTLVSGKMSAPGRLAPHENKMPLASPTIYPVVIKSGPQSAEVIEAFGAIGPVSLPQDFSVMAFYFQRQWGRPQFDHPERLKTPYTLLETIGYSNVDISEWVFNDLCVVAPMMVSRIVTLEFQSDAWKIDKDRILYSQVKGKFSIICYTDTNFTVELKPYKEVPPININVHAHQRAPTDSRNSRRHVQENRHPKLIIEFSEDWDKVVTKKPEFILEAADLSDIQIVRELKNVTITPRLLSERPPSSGDNPGKPGDDPDDDSNDGNDDSGGDFPMVAMIGIAGGVVLVGVIAFCLYWFAIRPEVNEQQFHWHKATLQHWNSHSV
jgi:hypothetical protein